MWHVAEPGRSPVDLSRTEAARGPGPGSSGPGHPQRPPSLCGTWRSLGDRLPTGNTEFQFKTADLNFHSDSYDWLVVTGSDYARFKGVGTINGQGGYKFQIWAGDADSDTFRIKIWTEEETAAIETVVYDNGTDQPIGGGSIIIHTKK